MSDETLDTIFAGRRGPLVRLVLKTGVLTILTVGLYRFWMKTWLRRWYWSATRPGRDPLNMSERGWRSSWVF